jgi:hypothetical protein
VVDVADRVVRPVMAEPEAGRLGAGGTGHDLVAQADPEQRPAVLDHRAGQRDGPVETGGIARPGREDHAIDLRREGDRGRDRVRQDPNARPAQAHPADDVRLQPVVDDSDQRSAVLGGTDVDDRGRRDLADEVLVLPAWDGAGPIHGEVAVREPGLGDDSAEAPVRPQVTRESARVNARDRRDRVGAEERRELAGVVEDRRRRVGDDEGPEPWPKGLVVVEQPAVVADQRIGHHDDLAGVRGVGADLLVAGLGGVHDEVAAGRDGRPERDPGEDGSVLEREERRTQITDARVDDRRRSGLRRGAGPDRDHPGLT